MIDSSKQRQSDNAACKVTLLTALDYHQRGQLDQAAPIYESLLARDPNQSGLLARELPGERIHRPRLSRSAPGSSVAAFQRG
jgi:hypothetical protein